MTTHLRPDTLAALCLASILSSCSPGKKSADQAETISTDAVRTITEAQQLRLAGRDAEALQKYRLVLKAHPNIKYVRDSLDELTRKTNPRAWFDEHPSDWGTWMQIFAELVNSNLIVEATAHLDKLPEGHERHEYEKVIEEKRRVMDLNRQE